MQTGGRSSRDSQRQSATEHCWRQAPWPSYHSKPSPILLCRPVPSTRKPIPSKPTGNSSRSRSESKTSTGSVTIGGQTIAYQAIAGTLIVHPKGWDDVPRDPKAEKDEASPGRRGRGQESDCRSVDVLRRLLQERRRADVAADHLPLQRRSGLGDGVAAHGRLRAAAHRAPRPISTRPRRRTRSSTTPRACSM